MPFLTTIFLPDYLDQGNAISDADNLLWYDDNDDPYCAEFVCMVGEDIKIKVDRDNNDIEYMIVHPDDLDILVTLYTKDEDRLNDDPEDDNFNILSIFDVHPICLN